MKYLDRFLAAKPDIKAASFIKKEQFKSFWMSVRHMEDGLDRRAMLDVWLKENACELWQGEEWERQLCDDFNMEHPDWRKEYQEVVANAFRQGRLHSGYFQHKLFSVYVNSGRIGVDEIELLNRQCLLLSKNRVALNCVQTIVQFLLTEIKRFKITLFKVKV